VIAYLIRYHGMSYDEALSCVEEKRPGIKPNMGFVAALRQWARDCQ
jgi:protein-tyrosine phosphatase